MSIAEAAFVIPFQLPIMGPGTSRHSLALAMVAVGLSCRPSGPDAQQPQRTHVARVASTSGAVDVLRAGLVDGTRAGNTAELYEDDRLRTFKGAVAQLIFDEGSSLRVEEETMIT